MNIKKNLKYSFAFWLILIVTINLALLNFPVSDSAPWVTKVVPSLHGMPFPHLAVALVLYMASTLPYLVALVYFSRHVLIYIRGRTEVPVALKGLWTLSFVAFLSFAVAIAGFKYLWLRDPRISASLTFIYSMVFLSTGVLSNLRLKK